MRLSWRWTAFIALATAILVGVPLLTSASGARPSRLLLPNLRPISPGVFHEPQTNIDPNYLFGGSVIVDGCTADEVVRKLARRCLRFDTVLANPGKGPFEISYRVDAEHDILAAHQRIYRSDGSRKSRFATKTEYHPTHLHFHVKDVYVARLWRANLGGTVRGSRPVARSDKNGFCPEDSRTISSTSAERRYSCFTPSAEAAEGVAQVVGISAGWADVYHYALPDQFIEISSVKDGLYLFELEIDPHDYFVESSERDNSSCMLIRLADDSGSILRQEKCPRP